jgi:hypothetical protein
VPQDNSQDCLRGNPPPVLRRGISEWWIVEMPPIDGNCFILLLRGPGIGRKIRLGDGRRGGSQEGAEVDMQLASSANKAKSGGLRDVQ